MEEITIIGGGLAGVEAAWQVLRRGGRVRLWEMKPSRFSPAHRSAQLAELVCSNSLKSSSLENASGLLKQEMKILGSLVMEAAEKWRVPAGEALAVDRDKFSEHVTSRLLSRPGISLVREEVTGLPESGIVIVAAGPLCSEALAREIEKTISAERLYFYDAIAPVVFAESVNREIAFRQSRYGKGGDDYLNCPLSREQYQRFYDELLKAETVALRDFEKPRFFEGCLPIEEMARRGRDTLAFGPMKPKGLRDPLTGREPFAAVQLRQENISAELYGLVGFQTRLKHPEQARIFRMIPGLEKAEFARFGSMHRNTYLDSPKVLNQNLSLKSRPEVFFAGQITGVEGYLESAACGMAAGIFALRKARGMAHLPLPPETAMGALIKYLATETREFVPMNVNFGLLPPPAGARKKDKKKMLVKRALELLTGYAGSLDSKPPASYD